MSQNFNEFKNKLIDVKILNPFPYVDPENSWKAPMFIDTANYLEWFKQMIVNVKSQGYCISFIVGDPGAGKTHFLCHLNYQYYEKKQFNGAYSIYSAHAGERITSTKLWNNLFMNQDVVDKIQKEIHIWEVERYRFNNISMKKIILSYLNNPESILSYNSTQISYLARGISQLLNHKGMHICIVIDNVDEYFRWMNSLRKGDIQNDEEEERLYGVNPDNDDVNILFSTLRDTATNMKGLILILACTNTAYIPMTRVSVDRTYASRIAYQDRILGPLTNSQAYELVNMYMDHWVKNNEVIQPTLNECLVNTSFNSTLNLCPFSKTAIDEIYNITGQYARDIKTICCESIDNMKLQKDMWIVKEKYLADAITEAHKKRPQIIPREKIESFYERRPEWLKESIKTILYNLEIEAHKKYYVITINKMIEILDNYIRLLNIDFVENIPRIKNTHNPNYWTDNTNLRIVNIKTTDEVESSIVISYVLSEKPPINRLYFQDITLKHQTDVISYIDNELASHALFIRLWSNPRSVDVMRERRVRELDDLIDEVSIDAHLYKIIASVEGSDEFIERSDLAQHVDRFYLNLKTQINQLAERMGQPLVSWEERLREMRRRAAEF